MSTLLFHDIFIGISYALCFPKINLLVNEIAIGQILV